MAERAAAVAVVMAFCRSCGAAIDWHTMESGKKMPVDKDAQPDGNLAYDPVANTMRVAPPGTKPVMYRSHFASCPKANDHRRR